MIKGVFSFILLFFSFSFALDLTFIDKWINTHNNLRISFIQTSYIAEIDDSQDFNGEIIINKPLAKIIYTKPYKQEILLKPDGIYIYSTEENQLIITSNSHDLFIVDIVQILSGKKSLNDVFTLFSKDKKDDLYILNLKHRTDKNLKKIIFFVKQDGQPVRIEIEDKDNNKIIFSIIDIKFSKNIKIGLNLKKDTEIID